MAFSPWLTRAYALLKNMDRDAPTRDELHQLADLCSLGTNKAVPAMYKKLDQRQAQVAPYVHVQDDGWVRDTAGNVVGLMVGTKR